MNIREFEFDFTYQLRTLRATCSVYRSEEQTEMPYKYPIYRVSFDTHKVNPTVFLFYKKGETGDKFFYYPFRDGQRELGMVIHDTLENLNL